MVVTKWVVTYHDYFEHFGARPQKGKTYADKESAYIAAAAIERHCGPGDRVTIERVTEEVADQKPVEHEHMLAWRAQKAKEAAEMAAFFERKKELLRKNMRSGSAKKEEPTSSEVDFSALEDELIF